MIRAAQRRPSGRVVRRTGLSLLVGVVGGWVAGLLRAPKGRQ
jgi:hypothetical protein